MKQGIGFPGPQVGGLEFCVTLNDIDKAATQSFGLLALVARRCQGVAGQQV